MVQFSLPIYNWIIANNTFKYLFGNKIKMGALICIQ